MKALITGATSGIGEALAYLLSAQGYALTLTGRDAKRLEQLAQKVRVEHSLVADLQNPIQRGQLIALIRTVPFDLIVNNAGFGIYGDALSIDVKDQLAILEVNAATPLELTLEAVRAWSVLGKQGVVMNISSVAGEHPCPGMSVYGASKAFLTHVSNALNTELAPFGISVLASCPGMVSTQFAQRAAKKTIIEKTGPSMTPQFAAQQIWRQIQKREEKRIFNWPYRLGSWLATYCLPRAWVQKIIWNRIKQRI
jgi:uncharacterized protein